MCDSCGCGHDHGATLSRPGGGRVLRLEQDVLAASRAIAGKNRALFESRGIAAVNLLSSPGSGKTTVLEKTIPLLSGRRLAVIEGDQQTANDAERIDATGVPVVQVNTGAGCHLDAAMVGRAVAELSPAPGSLLFIENVGNLVCPAMFDLGETARVVIISVTEGDDKPLKYPAAFQRADLCLINKIDLLPHVSFDPARCRAAARRVNPDIALMEISATAGQGLEDWAAWLGRLTARHP